MSNHNESAQLHDIEDGEIIEETSGDAAVVNQQDTMTLYEVDVMNLVKPMDLQQR